MGLDPLYRVATRRKLILCEYGPQYDVYLLYEHIYVCKVKRRGRESKRGEESFSPRDDFVPFGKWVAKCNQVVSEFCILIRCSIVSPSCTASNSWHTYIVYECMRVEEGNERQRINGWQTKMRKEAARSRNGRLISIGLICIFRRSATSLVGWLANAGALWKWNAHGFGYIHPALNFLSLMHTCATMILPKVILRWKYNSQLSHCPDEWREILNEAEMEDEFCITLLFSHS